MQGYNLILVYDWTGTQLLMCRRKKEPYLGLINLVGGKIEPGENGLDAAYRELCEETAITRRQIALRHLMDFTYHLSNCYVQVYVGRCVGDVNVYGDENQLFWSDLNHDFFDLNCYAGEGNIGHILEQVRLHRHTLWSGGKDGEPAGPQ